VAFAAAAGLALTQAAEASPPVRWSVGINFGGPPIYRPYPYYGPYGPRYYYRPYPVIVEPAPVIVQQPAPVYVQPAPTTVVVPAPAPNTTTKFTPVSTTPPAVDQYLQLLSNSEESTRRDAVMELGRLKAEAAVDPLTATLAGDASPVVRDAAARALGLIGSPRALTALIHAAQADQDRDVRRSAQFA